MKMLNEQELESTDHQEQRAQRKLDGKALLKAALLTGFFVLVVPAGGPWMSSEALTSAMGRHITHNATLDAILHFAFAVGYGALIAGIIFRLDTASGILLGTGLFVPLFGVNYLVFGASGVSPGNELHIGIGHFVFCLVFAVAYKAFSIPRRRRADGRPINS